MFNEPLFVNKCPECGGDLEPSGKVGARTKLKCEYCEFSILKERGDDIYTRMGLKDNFLGSIDVHGERVKQKEDYAVRFNSRKYKKNGELK